MNKYSIVLKNSLISKYNLSLARLEKCENSAYFKNPLEFTVNRRFLEIDRLYEKLDFLVKDYFAKNNSRFSQNVARLEALSPLKILSRGYAAAQKNGKVINSVEDVSNGDEITLRLSDGNLNCNVINVMKEKNDG